MESVRTFEKIVIIFNPNSTGDAPLLAEELRDRLTGLLTYTADLKLQPTNHAGHAIELVREVASNGDHVLVVSVSGDGGYNEVINGVKESATRTRSVPSWPQGTPMITRRTTGTKPLEEAIAEGNVWCIDLLRIHTGPGKEAPATYAHSYIGFGLTPVMAIDIEKGSKGALKEMFSAIRTFAKFEPFEIRQTDGQRRKFDSLVFANIPEMAKYATLSDADAEPSDGKFEVILFPHMPKWRVLLTALRATTQGLGDQPSISTY